VENKRERTRRKREEKEEEKNTSCSEEWTYIYVSICTHEVTPYMIKRSSKDDRAMYDKEIIER